MTNKTVTLAYHVANAHIASDLEQNLRQVGYEFEQLACDDNGAKLFEELSVRTAPVLLVISDNFLKSSQCMCELLPVFQDLIRSNRVQAIIADGLVKDPETGEYVESPTSFDKVSNVIQYMNYWQDQYLEVRRQKRELDEEQETALNLELKTIRSISSEIGEFLRFLRNKDHIEYRDFRANNFESFFRFVGDLETHTTFVASPMEKDDPVEELIELSGEELVDEVLLSVDENEGVDEIVELTLEESVAAEVIPEAEPEIDLSEIPGLDLIPDMNISEEEREEGARLSEFAAEEQGEEIDAPIEEPEDDLDFLKGIIDEIEEEDSTEDLEEEIVEEDVLAELNIDEAVEMTASTEEVIDLEEIIEEATEEVKLVEMDVVEAVEELEAETEIEEPTVLSADEALDAIHTAISNEDTETALSIYETTVANHPADTELRYDYAIALLQHSKDFDGATTQLETLLTYDTENFNAYFLLGELAEYRKDYEAAKQQFERVITLNTTHPEAYYRLGNIVANRFEDMESEASQLFEKAVEFDPENADAHYQFAILQDEYFDNPGLALEHYQYSLELDPTHPFAHYDLAVLYHGMEEFEKARIAYERATDVNSEVKTPENDLAFLHPEPAPEPTLELIKESIQEEEPEEVEYPELTTLALATEEVAEAVIHEPTIEEPTNMIESSRIIALQEDLRRLEELILKNQHLMLDTKQSVEEIVEEVIEETPKPPAKIALITGATSGIGKATADILAANGYNLILTGRRGARLEALKASYEEDYGIEVRTRAFDIRDVDAVQDAVESLEEDWRAIDILINNAGLAQGFEPINEGKADDWDAMIDTNVKGILYMTRAVSPYMVQRGTGHILNICSSAGKEVYARGGVYCATKHAVDALTKGMRLDLHQHNIRVSQVSPGHVEETEFALVRFKGNEERANIYEDFQPLKASDVAETIYFLLTRPPHVNIQDVLLYGTQQASASTIHRTGRAEITAANLDA